MIIPKIMPGEFIDGYLLRLGKINYIKKKAKTIAKLRALQSQGISSDEVQTPLLLSNVLGISIEDFLKYHTLWPILSSIISNEQSKLLENLHVGKLNKEFIKSKSVLKACRLCANEDVEFHGFSYWRKEHQLPGYQRCSKHNHQLDEFDSITFNSPYEAIKNSSGPVDVDIYSDNQAINNYMTIVDAWASSMKPIYHLTMTNMMQTKAKELDLVWSLKSKKKLASDLVFESFPLSWLEKIIPNTLVKVEGSYFGLIDRLFTPQPKASRSCLYALVLSVLYDDPNQALNAVNIASKSTPKIIEKKTEFDSGLRQKRYLKNIFIKNNGNHQSIAKELGLTATYTREMYKNHGYCSFEQISNKLKSALIDFNKGMGLVDACKKNDVSLDKMEDFLRSNIGDFTNSISHIYSNMGAQIN